MGPPVEARHAKVALAIKAFHCQAVDQVTAEVVGELRRAGIRAVVLKGPVFARWLYRDGTIRAYDDSDVMVAPADVARASGVLRSLEFEPLAAQSPDDVYAAAMGAKHALCWCRGGVNGALVDLHDSVAGAEADKEVVWAALTRDSETMELAGLDMEITGPAANALVAALHAAMNGEGHEGSCEDLARALEAADGATWSAAARLAGEIGAEETFAAGLRILPRGRELAETLGLAEPVSVELLLRAGSAPDGALFLEQLSTTRSWRARAALLGRALVPDASYMRIRYPLAHTGRAGLIVSYAQRAGRRLATFVPALLARASARREAGAARDSDR